jgi:hypothetical protein
MAFARLLAISSLLISFYFPSLAKENYKPGFVVLTSGDTLKGLIDDREWADSPVEFAFKNLSGEVVRYQPDQVTYFFIDSSRELYESVSLTFASRGSATRTDDTGRDREFSGFINVLVTGELALYKLTFLNNPYFFIKPKNGPIEQLIVKRIEGTKKNQKVVAYLPVYKNTLKNVSASCPKMQEKADGVSYKQNDLTNFVRGFNSCTTGQSEFVQSSGKDWVKRVGIIGSGYLGKLTIVDPFADKFAVNPKTLMTSSVGPRSELT